MEDKSFSWMLQIIAGRQKNLPILSTYIITDSKPIILISNQNNKLLLSSLKTSSVKDLLTKLLSDHSLKSKLKNCGRIVCYAITKTERIKMTEQEVKFWLSKPEIKQIFYIQPSMVSLESSEIYYILRLEYTKTDYVSNFFKQTEYEKFEFYDSKIFDSACDIANTIMAIIESNTKKRVMIIEIEFIEDEEKNLWITFIREIKLSEPILCLHFLVKTPDDLKDIPVTTPRNTKFDKLASGLHIKHSKQSIKPPMDYVFTKGHIRNRQSDLERNLQISPPKQKEIMRKTETTPRMIRSISVKKSNIRDVASSSRECKISDKRKASALRDEIMKSPMLKTQYKLAGQIGILGIEITPKLRRSLSNSDIINPVTLNKPKIPRPKTRLIVHKETPSRKVTSKYKKTK